MVPLRRIKHAPQSRHIFSSASQRTAFTPLKSPQLAPGAQFVPQNSDEMQPEKESGHDLKSCRSYWDFLAAFRATSLKSA
jgi:hypothetical protein